MSKTDKFAGQKRIGFRLYLITDRHIVKDGDLVAACEAALTAAPAGSVALQLREKDLPARELYELALRLREICTRAGAPLIVNDRVDVAIAAGADGVHLPFDSIGVSMARKLLGPGRLIGVSSHSPPDVSGAAREGADFAVFGPVFDPLSKPATGPGWGASGLAAACGAGAIPVFALGGITPERARELFASQEPTGQPAGVASIGAIFASDSPALATAAMLSAIDASSRRR
ncbi:MAG TPA: thiamine phosphate synthase [Candidatus Binatus sp.]|uniref:thiamine phosphate synthase n=1 Tax=Candidatus Binatus sp. TaxID=2811406 RepID=UPI002F40E907